eukprot:4300681-Pyramimonas_sp.AAC.1
MSSAFQKSVSLFSMLSRGPRRSCLQLQLRYCCTTKALNQIAPSCSRVTAMRAPLPMSPLLF